MPKPIFLRLPDGVAQKLLTRKPESLSLTSFCSLLLEQAVDTPVTLAERAEASVASTSSSILIDLEKELNPNNYITVGKNEKNASKKPKPSRRIAYSEDFEAFWKLYQSAPERVSSQTKPKAFAEWKAITVEEAPERLLEAVRRAIEEQKRKKDAGDFVGSLPDLFRWLRDGKYEIYLEEHKAQRSGKWWDEENRCWVVD